MSKTPASSSLDGACKMKVRMIWKKTRILIIRGLQEQESPIYKVPLMSNQGTFLSVAIPRLLCFFKFFALL